MDGGDIRGAAEGEIENKEDALVSIMPICPCGAGPCRRLFTVSGRAYLVCCIKKGFGACGFFQWVDGEIVQLEELVVQYRSDKLNLHCLSERHVQVLEAFTASSKRLKFLRNHTCLLGEIFDDLNKRLASCEAETLELGESCEDVAGQMQESQKRVQETAKKLAEVIAKLKKDERADGEGS